MIYIKWEDSFLLGVKVLDEHHMHLLDLLNRAYSGCMMNNPVAEFRALIDELYDYTGYHFSAEELIMKEKNYPGLPDQEHEHETFVQKLAFYREEIEKGNISTTIELVELTEFLANWFRNHIVDSDKKLGGYLNQLPT